MIGVIEEMGLDPWVGMVVQVGVLIGIAALGLLVVRAVTGRLQSGLLASDRFEDRHRKQLQTVVQVGGWLAGTLIVGVAGMMLLSRFVDITPLLASVGVMGLAVSLGAQTLIKDLLGGLLILFENQYAVGDVIKIGSVSGSVERLTLRATYVRDLDGNSHIVPNGDVRVVANVTRDWSRALVDLGVAYEQDLDRVMSVLEQEASAFAQTPELEGQMLEPPKVLGPLSLDDWSIKVRIMVKTQPGKQWGVAMLLRKRLLLACAREGIELPYPRQEVLVRNAPSAGALA